MRIGKLEDFGGQLYNYSDIYTPTLEIHYNYRLSREMIWNKYFDNIEGLDDFKIIWEPEDISYIWTKPNIF